MLQKNFVFPILQSSIGSWQKFQLSYATKICAYKTKLKNEQSTKKNSEVVILNGSPTY